MKLPRVATFSAEAGILTGAAGLTEQQFEDQLTSDAHRSFNTCLDTIFQTLVMFCSDAKSKGMCAAYKNIVHPNLPSIAPRDVSRRSPSRLDAVESRSAERESTEAGIALPLYQIGMVVVWSKWGPTVGAWYFRTIAGALCWPKKYVRFY